MLGELTIHIEGLDLRATHLLSFFRSYIVEQYPHYSVTHRVEEGKYVVRRGLMLGGEFDTLDEAVAQILEEVNE
jgi:hypothetical protein